MLELIEAIIEILISWRFFLTLGVAGAITYGITWIWPDRTWASSLTATIMSIAGVVGFVWEAIAD